MKKVFLAAAVMASLFLSAADARAGYIGSTPGSNNIIGVMEGFYGANLYLTGVYDIEVTYVGKEAAFNNSFNFGGGAAEVFTNTTPWGSTFLFTNVSAGLLNFSFTANGVAANTVVNGANVIPLADKPNFFITFDDSVVDGVTPHGGSTVLIAFDDNGSPDDNHDDLVVRLTAKSGTFSVPDGGATIALLGFGLMGLGVLRRRFGA